MIPFYRPKPLTDLPLIYHRDHLFPYTSFDETEPGAVARNWRVVVLENDGLRIEVVPELGGRVYSFFDKRLDREILFSNPVVKPVRILPIWAFISGGIEFNFPIAHSPTSMAEVGCVFGQTDDYGFIRVGEREARTGMEWAVELGLFANRPGLIQRSYFRNRTEADHPWMSWTICAVRSTLETEFIHPPHRVLAHNDRVIELDWPGNGLNWDRNYRQMTALFWKPGSAPGFGVFHHDLGFGLMHLADPDRLPGKKIWTYGHGRHRAWGQDTTEGGLSYAEIESGPLLDQSEKPRFPSGATRHFEEYWIPVHSRVECDCLEWAPLSLPPRHDPWLGCQHSQWQREWENFRAGTGSLPASTVPTGLDLESVLRRELDRGHSNAAEPLALWLAFHGRPGDALSFVRHSDIPSMKRLAGLILWKGLQDLEGAIPLLEHGPLHDPVAVAELDELYALLGQTGKRGPLLDRAPGHRLILERRIDLALACGEPDKAIQWLSTHDWPREHQRYVRTGLWRRAIADKGGGAVEVPDFLKEDNLAPFGAYWSDS
ncbi:MAG TPA: DUF5107 domain-containing protein [Candidatus Paceibacterota bacterium]|nr:DUF5107 domain-containing protein [Candidatus Paceibacterota bacterium]